MSEYPKYQISYMDGAENITVRAETADDLQVQMNNAMNVLRVFRGDNNLAVETLPEYDCPLCKGKMSFRSGVKKSTGKAWHAYFCDDRECKGVRWAKGDKTLK